MRPGARDVLTNGRKPGAAMAIDTWITLVVICGFVWGGFVLAVSTAFRKDSGKPD